MCLLTTIISYIVVWEVNSYGPLKVKSLLTENWQYYYWTRLSKISWFVSGEQMNYLPKPKAEANNWSVRHWQIMIFVITKFNNYFIIWSPSLFFEEYLWEVKQSAIFMQDGDRNSQKNSCPRTRRKAQRINVSHGLLM